MADTDAAPTTFSNGLVEAAPDERGTLDVKTKALQHIVERVVLDTPGTVAHASTLGRFVGAASPRADVAMQGRGARVSVDVAAVWPCPTTRIATQVRDRVMDEATRLSGVTIRSVDVTVHLVGADDTDRDRNLQ